jgi:hypothetical protein
MIEIQTILNAGFTVVLDIVACEGGGGEYRATARTSPEEEGQLLIMGVGDTPEDAIQHMGFEILVASAKACRA